MEFGWDNRLNHFQWNSYYEIIKSSILKFAMYENIQKEEKWFEWIVGVNKHTESLRN